MNMETRMGSIHRDDPVGEAEQWFARLLDPACTSAERQACRDWQQASEVHARAWREVECLWAVSGEAIQGDAGLMAMALDAARVPARRNPRRWRVPALAAAAVLVLAILWVPLWWYVSPAGTEYVTGVGQQQTITLSDGSKILLDTDSHLHVSYDDAERRIDMQQGRAQFSVHGDKHWPFVVHAGDGTVTALGTRFQVGLDEHKVKVALLEGHLAIATDADGRIRHASLSARQGLSFDDHGVISPVQPVDMAAAEGWTTGTLFAHDWSLPDLLREMNRYSTTQLVIVDPALRKLHVSGVFEAGDQESLIKALQLGWSIRARRLSVTRVELSRK